MLEQFLGELNDTLGSANDRLLEEVSEISSSLPVVLVFGAPRSGTTLFMQWLAVTGLCAYPSNLLSRFYGAPLVGAKIQQLLTNPRFAFRAELSDLQMEPDFSSDNGKTAGTLSPNEFWYFWRRFGFGENNEFVDGNQLLTTLSGSSFREELHGLAHIFDKPFALKAMIANQHIEVLREVLDRAVYIWIKREPVFNIQSLLEARMRQHGTIDQWYSFEIKEYPELVSLEPHLSVAGQVYYSNKAIQESLDGLPEGIKLVVDYEELCQDPEHIYQSLQTRLANLGVSATGGYSGPVKFIPTNDWRLSTYSILDVASAYESFFA